MIVGLVFSKDRALQLDACLASFFRHVQDASSVEMNVLYDGSSGRLRAQYEELARSYDGRARFVPEASLRRQVLRFLKPAALSSREFQGQSFARTLWPKVRQEAGSPEPPSDFVLLLVDDTLFVGSVNLTHAQSSLQENLDALGFSLRLGRNTTYSYVLDRPQQMPAFQPVADGILKYVWTSADGDFAYPLEISSSLYRLSTLNSIVPSLRFTNPSTLESQLAVRASRFARASPWMLCTGKSVAFSTPLNLVQTTYNNRAGTDPELSTVRLADRFDRGLRIDVAAMDGFVPSACHQEVELSFEPKAV